MLQQISLTNSTDFPVSELLAYAKQYAEPFEAWANFIADYDGDYFGKIWSNIRDRIHFKQYKDKEELKQLQQILAFYFQNCQYHGFALSRELQEYHRLKIIFTGHRNPDFDSIGTALATLYKIFQSPYLGHARLSLSYQGKVADYILNVIDDIALGQDRGNRSFIRKLLQRRETYQPQVKDVMTLYKDCRRIHETALLADVLKSMVAEKLQVISVLDGSDVYLGCIRQEEAYQYFFHLYQEGLLGRKQNSELLLVRGFLRWKENYFEIKPTIPARHIPQELLDNPKVLETYFEKSLQKNEAYVCVLGRAEFLEKLRLDKRLSAPVKLALRELLEALPPIRHKQVDPATSLRDRDLLKQLKESGSVPVIRNQVFQGLLTRQHLDKTGVFVYCVDTQDWKTMQGVSEDMIIGYMDHHARDEGIRQTMNLLAGQFESTGACMTLSAKDSLVHENSIYWPKKLILMAMATLADDTDFFNVDEGKATPTDMAVYRSLVMRYYRGTAGFDEHDKLNVDNHQTKMTAYLRELISGNRQKDIAHILEQAAAAPKYFGALLVDYKTDPGMKESPFTYWIGQTKINQHNYTRWLELNFKDWFLQLLHDDPKLCREYRLDKDNVIFFTSAEQESALQQDEMLLYTKVPGKMIPLSIYIIQHMPRATGAPITRTEIKAYRRLRTDIQQVFRGNIADKLRTVYPAETIDRLFERLPDKALALKREVEVSEAAPTEDIDTVLQIMATHVWKEPVKIAAVKQHKKDDYQAYLCRVYDPQCIILKYPAGTVTSRKRQVQRLMTAAMDRVYGDD